MKPNRYYHIYNHANGFENLFLSEENYRFFLEKYFIYISPIADTYCYCLMPNHFHFFVKIKDENEINNLIHQKASLNYVKPFLKFKTLEKVNTHNINDEHIEKYISKQFSNLFSSYTQAFNKMYNRAGSLFIKNFKRKEVTNNLYLKELIIYIHLNPIHHGFCDNLGDWNWSSYIQLVENKNLTPISKETIEWFDSIENFKETHIASIHKKVDALDSIIVE